MVARRSMLSRLVLAFIALATTLSSLATFTAARANGAPTLEIENLDGLPANDRFVFQRINCGPDATREDFSCIFLPQYPFHKFNTLRIKNSGTAALNVSSLAISGSDTDSFRVANAADRGPFSIAAGGQRDILLEMEMAAGSTLARKAQEGERYATLTINSNDPTRPQLPILLAGYNMPEEQGTFEPQLQELFNLFGYAMRQVNPNAIAANGLLENLRFTQPDPNPGDNVQECSSFNVTDQDQVGDEIVSPLWARADASQPVFARQLIASHKRDFAEAIRIPGNGGGEVAHHLDEYQSILPYSTQTPTGTIYTYTTPASMVITPTSSSFEILGANRSSIRPAQNPPRSRALIFYPLRDGAGRLVPNSYIFGQDYVGSCETNFDFQDNVWLITNVRPISVTADPNLGQVLPGSSKLKLEFDQNAGATFVDKDGEGTGFSSVQRNRFDFGFPDRPPTGTLSSTLLDLNTATSRLDITSSGGNIEGVNDLRNAMCLPFDGRHGRYTISTRLLGPFSSGYTPSIKMAGLLFGPSQHDFIRLSLGTQVVAPNTGRPWIQLTQELSNTIVFSSSQISLASFAPSNNLANVTSLDLELTGDAASGEVSAAFRVNGGAPQAIPEKMVLSGVAFNRIFAPQTAACIHASHRFTSPFTASFDYLRVEPAFDPDQEVIARYNVGGPALTTDDGVAWQSDAGLFTPASAPAEPGASFPAPADIAETTQRDAIYKTYRGNVGNLPLAQREITFTIPISQPQTVDLRLHFAELYWGRTEPNTPAFGSDPDRIKRMFDIYVEDKLVLGNFNITRAADGPATAVVVPIENISVTGDLTIRLKARADYAALSAIEVLRQPNVAPLANAGDDRSVPLNQPVTLQGAATDANNDPLTYAWASSGRPAGSPPVTLSCASGATCVFTPTQAGAYTFTLTVSDTGGLSDNDSVVITAMNQPPVARAGGSQTVKVGTPATLDGSASSDPEGAPLSYKWAQIGGTNVTLSCTGSGAVCTYTPTVTGELTFGLTVTDSGSLSNSESFVVSVFNGVPTVEPGSSQIVQVSEPVTLSAVGSDPDGDPLTYIWTQTGGLGVSLSQANSATPSFTAPPIPTTLTFQVRARDPFNTESAPATVTVEVRNDPKATSSSPTLLGQTTFFTATASGDGLTYNWNFGDGASGVGANTSHVYAQPGVYTATVSVTNGGETSNLSTRVLVFSAGQNKSVPTGGNVILGSALGGDTSGISFLWEQLSGPSVALQGADTPQPSFGAPSTSARLSFRLTVTKPQGQVATDIVEVTVVSDDEAPEREVRLPLITR
jgi:PKD repeat protein